MAELTYKTSPLWKDTTVIAIAPMQSTSITIADIKTAAKYLNFQQTVVKNGATLYQFQAKSSINCKISYKSEFLKNENFMILFNRDTEDVDGVFTNIAILELQGNDIAEIILTITNNSTADTLTINSMAIYESDDVQITTIAKVLKEETIAADVIQATSSFTDSLFTQLLQTSVMSMTTRNANPGDVVNYLKIENYTQSFYRATLGTETEQFSITTTTAGTESTTYYWYAVIEGEDAYKYITTVDPRTKYPDISDSNRDAFKLLVYKPITLVKDLEIKFAEADDGTIIPSIVYGAGSSAGTRLGKGFTYKNSNGFYHTYVKEDGTGTIGIIMDSDGVHIKGLADQHCEYIKFRDNGVQLKYSGENEHKFEYIFSETDDITGYIQDSNYITNVSYEAGNV
jgi:hypothetical protein